MTGGGLNGKKIADWIIDNIVTIIFVAFTLLCFLVSTGVSVNFFFTELAARFFRNAFMILSLIIPVVAGLGLNFGIVVGAMSGQIALIIVRYFEIGGVPGFLLCVLIATPISAFCGYLTGKLYNKTRGQEMIASLIVGYFANGIYQFILLFVVGVIIPVSGPLIKPDGIGIMMTVDLLPVNNPNPNGPSGLKDVLDNILTVPFMWAVFALAVFLVGFMIVRYFRRRNNPAYPKTNMIMFFIYIAVGVGIAIFSIYCIMTQNAFTLIKKAPVVTILAIVALCIFTDFIMKTKLGQDFRSVGQSQHISKVSGIDVDRTRLIAVIMSTVFASWGMLIYLQNMGTLNTYGAHAQIGMFSVASILVGGASTSKATVKHAVLGTILFNAMFIMSPELGKALFGQAILGEYFRTFMVYGVIGLALGLYAWKATKKSKITIE